MKSIKDLYKIGKGPSSSHTMGPERACKILKEKYSDAEKFKVILYGSLSKTGAGHGTDKVIKETLYPVKTDLIFASRISDFVKHPNTIEFIAVRKGDEISRHIVESIGGGDILIDNVDPFSSNEIYAEKNLQEILNVCKKNDIPLSQYVFNKEESELTVYLNDAWHFMKSSIHNGLSKTGILPGGLNIKRKARILFEKEMSLVNESANEIKSVCSYAYAVSEENADNGIVVTAPTCGSCGVLPAVLYYEYKTKNISNGKIIEALAVAGIIGNIIKRNASISGAECGCQAEIGSACAMAAAALAYLRNMNNEQIACACEIALEHSLGLTCDPVCGLVQVPCIERNAIAACRAIDACDLAYFITSESTISFDDVVEVLAETGRNMSSKYRETSEGGLANLYKMKDK